MRMEHYFTHIYILIIQKLFEALKQTLYLH